MEIDLRDAFYGQVKTYADGVPLRVTWGNTDFDPSGDAAYLRVSMLNTSPTTFNTCATAGNYVWVLQVSVYVRDGVGERPAIEYAEAIRALLPQGTRLTNGGRTFTVLGPAEIISPVPLDGWYSVPVQIRVMHVG